jgi:hypothetical protein
LSAIEDYEKDLEDSKAKEQLQYPGTFPLEEIKQEESKETLQKHLKALDKQRTKRQSTMPGDESTGSRIKIPTPRIFSSEKDDREASVVDAWTQEVKDYLELKGVPTDKQMIVIQYLLSGSAKKYYQTKRTATRITLDTFLKDLKNFFVPSTHVNNLWDK